MPGVAGSLLQLCESAGGLGCALDLGALPVPSGMPLERWLVTFPSYGFLLVGDAAALAGASRGQGLAARVGTLDDAGSCASATAARGAGLGPRPEPLTGLRPPRLPG